MNGPLLALAQELLHRGGRRLLGIAGAPGSGKSTLALALRKALPRGSAVVVPMDGFHLAQAALERLGRADRKGAPDTFDGAGFVALVQRLRTNLPGETVWAPAFRREIEEPIAGAIAVEPSTPLVIVEGNYLLLDEPPWRDVLPLLDASVFVDIDDPLRRSRLVARHVSHGRTDDEAREWVLRSDEANARRVIASASRASHRVRLSTAD